jgi:acyl-CoA thioesterase
MNDAVSTPAASHPFAELIGLETGDSTGTGDNKVAICTLAACERHLNPHGVVHGAVLYALTDTGMGAALSRTLDPGELCSTIEIKINYFRPAFPGDLRCETRTVHRGRRTAALESEVFDAQGKLLARATGTFMILRAD